MAKMFYNLDEVQEKLGLDKDQVQQLVAQSKLREFRDGVKIMFKVEEVDRLAAEGAGDDSEIRLSPEDSTSEIGLAPEDTSDTSSDEIGLAPLDSEPAPEDSGSEIMLAPTESSSFAGLGSEDTAEQSSPDTGDDSLGPIGLAPLADSAADQVDLDDTDETTPSKDDTVLTSHGGINVLEDSDSDKEIFADPLAQTQIAPDMADQVQLDSGSSGSGLLDLTREADDTSLGAELLEEIYPGTDQEGAIETQVPTGLDVMTDHSSSLMAEEGPTEPMVSYARAVEVYDPASGAYGIGLLIPLVFLIYLAITAIAGAMGIALESYSSIFSKLSQYNFYIWIGGLVVTGAIVVIGLMVTNSSTGPSKPKTKKPRPEKKPKKKKK